MLGRNGYKQLNPKDKNYVSDWVKDCHLHIDTNYADIISLFEDPNMMFLIEQLNVDIQRYIDSLLVCKTEELKDRQLHIQGMKGALNFIIAVRNRAVKKQQENGK